MTEWQPIVKRNREATQLDFSENPDAHLGNINNKLNSGSVANMSAIKELSQFARDFEAKEAAERQTLSESAQNTLLKNKHLLLYQEIKAKRLKKIKSKIYRRIKKKQREREEEVAITAKIGGNKEALLEEVEKMERKRAEVQ